MPTPLGDGEDRVRSASLGHSIVDVTFKIEEASIGSRISGRRILGFRTLGFRVLGLRYVGLWILGFRTLGLRTLGFVHFRAWDF